MNEECYHTWIKVFRQDVVYPRHQVPDVVPGRDDKVDGLDEHPDVAELLEGQQQGQGVAERVLVAQVHQVVERCRVGGTEIRINPTQTQSKPF